MFDSGFDEYDRRLMYVALKDAQDFWRGDQVMGVEMKIKNIDIAAGDRGQARGALGGPPYRRMDWDELNNNLFTALKLQKLALMIILTLIIVVAAVNMVSALTMMVTDKTKRDRDPQVDGRVAVGTRGRSSWSSASRSAASAPRSGSALGLLLAATVRATATTSIRRSI